MLFSTDRGCVFASSFLICSKTEGALWLWAVSLIKADLTWVDSFWKPDESINGNNLFSCGSNFNPLFRLFEKKIVLQLCRYNRLNCFTVFLQFACDGNRFNFSERTRTEIKHPAEIALSRGSIKIRWRSPRLNNSHVRGLIIQLCAALAPRYLQRCLGIAVLPGGLGPLSLTQWKQRGQKLSMCGRRAASV